jgi:hypothetical protein
MAITYQYANADHSQAIRNDSDAGTNSIVTWHPTADHPIGALVWSTWVADGSPKPAEYVESEELDQIKRDAGVK